MTFDELDRLKTTAWDDVQAARDQLASVQETANFLSGLSVVVREVERIIAHAPKTLAVRFEIAVREAGPEPLDAPAGGLPWSRPEVAGADGEDPADPGSAGACRNGEPLPGGEMGSQPLALAAEERAEDAVDGGSAKVDRATTSVEPAIGPAATGSAATSSAATADPGEGGPDPSAGETPVAEAGVHPAADPVDETRDAVDAEAGLDVQTPVPVDATRPTAEAGTGELLPVARSVLDELRRRMDADGFVTDRAGAIAAALEMHVGAVAQHIRRLKEAGWLRKTELDGADAYQLATEPGVFAARLAAEPVNQATGEETVDESAAPRTKRVHPEQVEQPENARSETAVDQSGDNGSKTGPLAQTGLRPVSPALKRHADALLARFEKAAANAGDDLAFFGIDFLTRNHGIEAHTLEAALTYLVAIDAVERRDSMIGHITVRVLSAGKAAA